MKKFELTNETINIYGRTLYRIRALRDFGYVNAGDLGGFVEKEENLSHDGKSWVFDNAKVFDDAQVFGDARVFNNVRVYSDARVGDKAYISGNARVYGNVRVGDNATIVDYARVRGDARVFGNAIVSGKAYICGTASITELTHCMTIGLIGSRGDTTTFFRTKDKEIYVTCGCFTGSIQEFIDAVDETHGENKHGQVYRLACQLAEAQIDLSDNVSI